jgi:hypothetical protein
MIKLVTAVVSWGTVLALCDVAPKALSLRSPEELEREISERRKAEQKLLSMQMQLEQRVAESLPSGKLLPRELRDSAVRRVAHAPALTGPIHIKGLIDIDPIWRPLILALAETAKVSWSVPDDADCSWYPGEIIQPLAGLASAVRAELCAEPRAEVVEALRWAREVLSRGDTAAADVAIAATSPEVWDNHFLVLSAQSGLPVHFSHGVPALSTADGQACAALADILVNGINQQRVRRLIRRLPRSDFRERLPHPWAAGLPRSAGLFTVDQWRRVLNANGATQASDILIPVLEILARGTAAAEEAGALILSGQSRLFWEEALRIAPAEAITLSLSDLRVPDRFDPGNSVVWGPASHLAASPRPNARLLGLNSGSWPRAASGAGDRL